MPRLHSRFARCAITMLAAWMALLWTLVPVALAQSAEQEARAVRAATQMQRSLLAIEDGQRDAPRDRWDPQYVVDTVGIEADDLYGWVQANVGWVPYRGALRGPTGVLMDRVGNSLDQSLLLAELLRLAGYEVRLAHADLPTDTAMQLWQAMADNQDAAAAEEPTGVATEAPAAVEPPPAAASEAEAAAQPEPATEAAIDQTGGEPTPVDAGAAAEGTTEAPSDEGAASTASDALSALDAGTDASAPGEDNPTELQEIADQYGLDAESTGQALASANYQSLLLNKTLADDTLVAGFKLLSSIDLPPADEARAAEVDAAFAALTDHWWVEASQDGSAWRGLDLLNPAGAAGPALAKSDRTLAPDALPDDLVHRVTLRLVAEQWKDGKVQERPVLEAALRASDLIGQHISLSQMPLEWPADWEAVTPADVQVRLFAALRTQREWLPLLQVGDKVYQQSSIRDTGEINENPSPTTNPFFAVSVPAGGRVGQVTDIFSDLDAGLGGEEGAASGEPTTAARAEGEFTAEWLDYQIASPGQPVRTVRREIFDLIGQARRAAGIPATLDLTDEDSLSRSIGVTTQTDLVVMPCAIAPEFLMNMTAQFALDNRAVLDEFAADPFGKAPGNSTEIFAKMSPMAGPAYQYAALRFGGTNPDPAVFIDRPNVVAQHAIMTRVKPGELTVKVALDIIANGVGVDPFIGSDPFASRVMQGVADTNAEALALGGEPVVQNTAQSYLRSLNGGVEWPLLVPGDEALVADLELAPDTAARILADLADGKFVMVPTPDSPDRQIAGWWRIDPQTGETLGVAPNGWGVSLVEYAFVLTVQLMLAQIACMAYTAAAEPKISQLTAEQGREKVKAWAASCVSQALLQTLSGLSTSWITSRFLSGATLSSKSSNNSGPSKGGFTNSSNSRPNKGPTTTSSRGSTGPGSNTRGSGSTGSTGSTSQGSSKGGPRPEPNDPRSKPKPPNRKEDPCLSDLREPGRVRLAFVMPDPSVATDAPSLLLRAGWCKRNEEPPSRKPPTPEEIRNKQLQDKIRVEPHTKAVRDAVDREYEAAQKYIQNKTPQNLAELNQRIAERQNASMEELRAWKGKGTPPGAEYKDAKGFPEDTGPARTPTMPDLSNSRPPADSEPVTVRNPPKADAEPPTVRNPPKANSEPPTVRIPPKPDFSDEAHDLGRPRPAPPEIEPVTQRQPNTPGPKPDFSDDAHGLGRPTPLTAGTGGLMGALGGG